MNAVRNPGRLSPVRPALAMLIMLVTAASAACASGNFRFTVTADPRDLHTAFGNVLSAINANVAGPGAFHVTIGDEDDVTSGTPEANRAKIDAAFGSTYLWYPIIGNHESDPAYPTEMQWMRSEYTTGHNGRAPLKNSTLQNGPSGTAETNYSFDYGNAHFIVINEYWNGGTAAGSDVATDGDVVPNLLTWLTNDINSTTKKAIFVFGHEPAFPFNNHTSDSLNEHLANRDSFWNLLESKGVAAYLCGHTHVYSKYQKTAGKTWQIDCGNAGNDNMGTGYTFLDITVSDQSITFHEWHAAGSAPYALADSWTFPIATPITARVFYNNSAYDGHDAAANADDDAAIATDKSPLLPGGTATLANYTSYNKGLNGIMIDIPSMPGTPAASDFTLKKGNSSTPTSWTAVTVKSSYITVRKGAGANGTDRVTLTLPDGMIANTWLQVTAKASANTGVSSDTVFYFGNAIGETGNSASSARVDSADVSAVRADPRKTFANPAPITDMCDFNRDKIVNTADEIIARSNMTTIITQLNLISVP